MEMEAVFESKKDAIEHAKAEIEVTSCPDCGTEWEVVVTEHPRPRAANARREG